MRTLIFLTYLTTSTFVFAQEQSVKPGINDSFKAPVAKEFVERFEKEGREVYDHREEIIQKAHFEPGMVVADVGAGTGLFTRLIAKEVGSEGRVIAVDIAKEFVDHVVATSREEGLSNVTGKVCKPDSVDLPEESVDAVFICDTYHHFEFPYKTMRSIFRALKPQGRVILVEFHREEGKSTDWILGHIRAGQDVFVKEIKTSGFDVLGEEKFLETSYFMIFQKADHITKRGHTTDAIETIRELVQEKSALMIDVREPKEWEAGHLKDAQLFPLSDMQTRYSRGTIDELELPKDQIIYIHCKAGIRAMTAAQMLRELGYDARACEEGYEDLVKFGFDSAE